jgi:hypothetical protein
MTTTLARIGAILATLATLAGCVVYDPYYPYGAPPPRPNTFERSWNAAAGALADQGVQVYNQDRAAGVIEGRRGDLTVRARVITQADGAVRVEFNTTGTGADSQSLSAQVSRAYDVRMGR